MSLILLGILNSQVTAGGGGAAYDLLETQVLSSSAASVTFTGLGSYSNYKHLQIRAVARDTGSGTYQLFGVRLNGDSGANYTIHGLFGANTSVDSVAATASTSSNVGFYAGSSAPASSFGVSILDFLDFSNANKNTTIRSLTGVAIGTGSRTGLYSGLWINTSPVTNIDIFARTTSFASGTRFSLYGVKA